MDFVNDDEVMRDFFKLTKEEFLNSYSYLSEQDYDATKQKVDNGKILEITLVGTDSWDRPVYKGKDGTLYKDVDLGHGNNLRSSLNTSVGNSFDGEPYMPLDENVIVKVIRYIPIKEIKGNEDLQQIAEKIKFQEDVLMPEDITREQFIKELKSQIEWELDMVAPSVSKDILHQEYLKLLKIEDLERKRGKNMKNYENAINKNNTLQNTFALNILLQVGRNNLLNEDYFKNMLDSIDDKKNMLMSDDYQKEVYEIARKMAQLQDKDLCNYIYDKVKEEKKLERGR